MLHIAILHITYTYHIAYHIYISFTYTIYIQQRIIQWIESPVVRQKLGGDTAGMYNIAYCILPIGTTKGIDDSADVGEWLY